VEQRKKYILVVVLLMFASKIFSQQKADTILLKQTSLANFKPIKITSITPDFYTKHFGFFCKKELLLEKKTSVPFRFRLGSLEYVNRLEGKK